MKRFITGAVLFAGTTALCLSGATAASAATKTIGNPVCFSGDGGTCTPVGNGKSVDLVSPAVGSYAGVYFNAKNTQGKAPAAVDYSFDYVGSQSGGAPRFSIPIDETRDGTAEAYAFMDANSCGTVGSGTVSTTVANCGVYYQSDFYPNWDLFSAAAAANGWTVAKKDTPFIIVDSPSEVRVSNIAFVVD